MFGQARNGCEGPSAAPTGLRLARIWRRSGGAAYDESRRELDVQRLEALPLQEAVQQADRRPSHLGERLAHGGQLRGNDGGALDVVEADDGQVVGNAEAARTRRL